MPQVGDKGEVAVKVVENFKWWCAKLGSGGQSGG